MKEEIQDLHLVLAAADAWEDEYIHDETREAIVRVRARLEGTDPLTDEEMRALLLMEPSGPLPENGHEARAVASARSKLRARLARADG